MIVNLPQTYLIGLCLLSLVIAILVGRQFYKVRRDELKLIKLEKESRDSSTSAQKFHEIMRKKHQHSVSLIFFLFCNATRVVDEK